MEQIKWKGVVYKLEDHGVVSDALKKTKSWTWGEEPDEDQVAICIAWLQEHAKPRKRVNNAIGKGSYSLKHVVERAAGHYVTNGAFILAAHRLGYVVIPEGPRSPNAHFRATFTYDKWA